MATKKKHEVYTGLTARYKVLWKCACGAEGEVERGADIPAPHSMQERRRAAA